jgi:hypothetical protein
MDTHRLLDRGRFADARRILGRADEDEVVEHHGPTLDAGAGGHERRFRGRRMDQEHVGLAALAQLQRGSGADGDRFDPAAGGSFEEGQQLVEEAGVLGAGRGGEEDGGAFAFGGRGRLAAYRRSGGREQERDRGKERAQEGERSADRGT